MPNAMNCFCLGMNWAASKMTVVNDGNGSTGAGHFSLEQAFKFECRQWRQSVANKALRRWVWRYSAVLTLLEETIWATPYFVCLS